MLLLNIKFGLGFVLQLLKHRHDAAGIVFFACMHACICGFVGDINSQESCFEVFVGSSLSIIEIWGLSPLMLMNDECMTHFACT